MIRKRLYIFVEGVDDERFIERIIKPEIESWYLSGLKDEDSKKLTNSPFKTTDDINKEQFNLLQSKKFSSRIEFKIEILNNFSIDIAKRKNRSFKYFMEKFVS